MFLGWFDKSNISQLPNKFQGHFATHPYYSISFVVVTALLVNKDEYIKKCAYCGDTVAKMLQECT